MADTEDEAAWTVALGRRLAVDPGVSVRLLARAAARGLEAPPAERVQPDGLPPL